MRYYRSIYINERDFPVDLYEEIVRLSPESRKQEVFMLEAQPGDDERGQLCEKIAALCEQRGLKKTAGTAGTYGYTVVRHYDPADLLAASYLKLVNGAKMFKDHNDPKKRDASGRITLPAIQATAAVQVASVFPRSWMVVSDPVRSLLENRGLLGLQFGETILKGTSVKAAKHPFWELKSTITLPKMANSILIVERGSYAINDPPYHFGEPHYRQSDLKHLKCFDIAYAFESSSPYYQDQPLIISQNFYQCCLQNHIAIDVIPTRVDAD